MARIETVEIHQGAELPSVTITWNDDDGNLIDLTGYTFELRIGTDTTTVKDAGITGAATDPNVTIDWAVDDTATLPPKTYACQLWATRTSDGKDRVMPLDLRVLAAITA